MFLGSTKWTVLIFVCYAAAEREIDDQEKQTRLHTKRINNANKMRKKNYPVRQKGIVNIMKSFSVKVKAVLLSGLDSQSVKPTVVSQSGCQIVS